MCFPRKGSSSSSSSGNNNSQRKMHRDSDFLGDSILLSQQRTQKPSDPLLSATTNTTGESLASQITRGANSIAGLALLATVSLVLVGLLVNSILIGDHVRSLHHTNSGLESLIQQIQTQIDIVNASLPEGNGTVFFDDAWTMADGPHPGRQFRFNASLVASGTIRNYATPDTDGVILLDTTLNPVFPEDRFAIVGSSPDSPTTRIEFDLSAIPSATLHLFSWPNKNGVVATLTDLSILSPLGNETVFLDNNFAIVNYIDESKRALFNVGLLSAGTNRTVAFPDLDGTMALVAGAQTLSNKTWDDTNDIRVIVGTTATPVNNRFVLQSTAGVGFHSVTLTTTAVGGGVSADRTLQFPNLAGSLVLTTGTQTIHDKILDTSDSITLVGSDFMIEDGTSGYKAIFLASELTTNRTFTLQDRTNCTIACLDDIIRPVPSSLFLDSEFTIETATNTSQLAMFDASQLTTNRSFILPDTSGTLVTDATLLATGGTWSPTVTFQVQLSGTPVAQASYYTRVHNTVFCVTRITGLSISTTSVTAPLLHIGNLPASPSTFADTAQASGMVIATYDTVPGYKYDMGRIASVSTTAYISVTPLLVQTYGTTDLLTLHLVFAYRVS